MAVFDVAEVTARGAEVAFGVLVEIEAEGLTHLAELRLGNDDLARIAPLINDDLLPYRVHLLENNSLRLA